MTSDERRDVARKIREYVDAYGDKIEDAEMVLLGTVWRRGEFNEVVRPTSEVELLAMVADLIDPATSATTFTPGVGLETYPPLPIRLWKCARCGEETIMMYDEGEPVACPYCGAVVVSDDD